jgi:iron(III) transport system permease protein
VGSPADLQGDGLPADVAAAGGLTPGRPGRVRTRRRRAPLALQLVGAGLAALFGIPLGWLVIRSLGAGSAATLTSGQGLRPLVSSVALATATAAATAVVGTGAAWLTVRTDLRWARLFQLLLPLPLVVPSFIGAFTLLAAFAPGGLLDQLLPVAVGLPRLGGFPGAFAVLTLLTYPYVFLPVAARLRQLPASLEESARLLGRGGWGAFVHVVLPQTRTAILAGALLVFLYTISDFGAVQLLRYDTLTRVIYATRLDQATSIALSLQLGLLAVAVVVGERMLVRSAPPTGPRVARPLRVPLGRWQMPARLAVAALVLFSLAAPVSVLLYWAVRGIVQGSTRAAAVSADPASLVAPLVNTVGAGVAAAGAALCVVLPLAYLTVRHRGAVPATANAVVVGGFALPGLVVALSLASFALRGPAAAGLLYQTLALLVLAYTVHFGAQALRAAQVAVASVAPRVGDAARMLGAGGLRRVVAIDLPLMLPGLGAGAGLVLLSTMKELPATLLLAPPGFSTLATRIWNATEDAFWADASLASLVLIAISAVLTWVFVIRRFDALD